MESLLAPGESERYLRHIAFFTAWVAQGSNLGYEIWEVCWLDLVWISVTLTTLDKSCHEYFWWSHKGTEVSVGSSCIDGEPLCAICQHKGMKFRMNHRHFSLATPRSAPLLKSRVTGLATFAIFSLSVRNSDCFFSKNLYISR